MRIFQTGSLLLLGAAALAQSPHWTESAANTWYAKQPWLVGSNYIPANAINPLEMWQADTFDPDRFDMELGWAEDLGMNTMRVFLHDIPWETDPGGFRRRIDRFLRSADRHHIKPIFVLFDSCWDPFPEPLRQRPAQPGVHNSRWVQSPGARALMDPALRKRSLEYVRGIMGVFGDDKRILAWDLWNEPDNTNSGSYGKIEPVDKVAVVTELLPKVFEWARAAVPSQPLTSGLWRGDWSSREKLSPIEKIQIEQSDLISFHSYGRPDEFEKRIAWLEAFHRPILCTEYMARPNGSTFQGILPIAREHHVAAINWGFAAGKTQTYLPWDSWQHPYTDRQPSVWFHDIFRSTGEPYSQEEVNFIRQIIGHQARRKKAA